MARRKKRGTWVLTTTGLDGAAAAAMVLLTKNDAEVVITSKNRSADTLATLAGRAASGSRVHVCGVGTGEALEEIVRNLGTLRENGVAVTWYCGRGYLDDAEEALAAVCETVFEDCGSNTECVFRRLEPPPDALTKLLLTLAEAFVEKRETLPKEETVWRNLIRAATTRAFQFEEETALPEAIRALAGLRELTPHDYREIRREEERKTATLPLGRSPAMTGLRRVVGRVAPLEEPVLVLGPSGAGKELVARSIHDASLRADAPFVDVNCAILSTSADLAQDRLFGHIRGAFTGAKEEQPGAFATADGGTLFLDEVAEIPKDVQKQLLRVLEEKSFTPVGTMASRSADVRVIAATNRNLPAMVAAGDFRLDLFYRLNVLTLVVPSLTERTEDLPTLADAVRHRLAESGLELRLEEADWEAIRAYDWPGNIRQFHNILKRAACMQVPVAEAIREERALGLFPPESAASAADGSGSAGRSGGDASAPRAAVSADPLRLPTGAEEIRPLKEVRRAYMRRALALCENNYAETARRLEVAVNTVRNNLQEA